MRKTRTVSLGIFGLSVIAGFGGALGGCGGSNSSPSTTSTQSPATEEQRAATANFGISTSSLAGLGEAIVDQDHRTLYIFVPDKHAKVTCLNTCAQIWPPAKLTPGKKPTVSGKANPALLGSDPDPEGGRVMTYAGWPLYTYIADSTPGAATGQALNANGGLWYVIAPSGRPIQKTP
ncbi:MAG: COG4315 family predicted lipoprotein [Solirubrobacteraceae bacterium]